MSPFRFICADCGAVLLEDDRPNLTAEFLRSNRWSQSFYLDRVERELKKCPKCGRKLEFPPKKIEVFAHW